MTKKEFELLDTRLAKIEGLMVLILYKLSGKHDPISDEYMEAVYSNAMEITSNAGKVYFKDIDNAKGIKV